MAVLRREVDAFLAPILGDAHARIILTGAGTSAFAGAVLAPVLTRRLGRAVEAIATTDLVSNPLEYFTPDVPTVLVSFARSGDSPESFAATQLADQVLTNVRHLVITCNPTGRLATTSATRDDALVLQMPDGSNDKSFAMTSSFTSMTLTAYLAFAGEVEPAHLDALVAAGEKLLGARADEIRSLALTAPGRLVYLGSGALQGLARESALKMLELTAGEVMAISDSPLGFRHGPKSMINAETTVIVYLSNDPYTRQYDLDIVAELTGNLDPSRVVVVNGTTAETSAGTAVPLTGTADLDDALLALAAVLVAQLIAMNTSVALGHTPDNPFPSGVVNRVVQGVTLYPLADEVY
nr:SIS domain-containing protein [Leifsonia psychrotolerans]